MIKKSVSVVVFSLALECYSMTAEEAALRCKTSIEKTDEIRKHIKIESLKQIAQKAISLMQKNLEKLPKSTLQSIPTITQQCIKNEERVLWLKEDIEPEMQDLSSLSSIEEAEVTKKRPDQRKDQKKKIKELSVNSKILKKILQKKEKSSKSLSL